MERAALQQPQPPDRLDRNRPRGDGRVDHRDLCRQVRITAYVSDDHDNTPTKTINVVTLF